MILKPGGVCLTDRVRFIRLFFCLSVLWCLCPVEVAMLVFLVQCQKHFRILNKLHTQERRLRTSASGCNALLS